MTLLAKFLRLPLRDQLLLMEAALHLALASLLVRLLPFRRLAPFLGAHKAEAPDIEDARLLVLVDGIGWSVQTVARHTPWRAVCLPSAIAAKLMLRRRGIPSTLCLGVSTDAPTLTAHAWLRVGSRLISGADGRDRYTKVSVFGA